MLEEFGMIDTTFQTARSYLEIVPRRDKAILTNILNAKSSANSVIYWGKWSGYQNLPQYAPACILHNTVLWTVTLVFIHK